eukprot:c24125_g1_i2 orf=794-1654(+)
MEHVPQGAVLSFGTAIVEEEGSVSTMVPVHLKPVAGSSKVDVVDPFFNNRCPHSDGSVIICNAEECLSSGQLFSTGRSLCNLIDDSPYFEKGKSLNEVRATKNWQVCAICHDMIKAEEAAEIKGCEHSYCVTCILRWASYKAEPWCPQCRLPFSFLYVYKALDGTLRDYLFEESVCLLLRACWFKPLVFHEPEEQDDYQDDYDAYEEPYYTSSVRLGNRRWGDSGYVRAGRREARPVGVRQVGEPGSSTSSSSRQAKGKEPAKEAVGRRARRAQKREQLDKMSDKK